MALTRDQIVSAKFPVQAVPCPEWGTEPAYVRTLSADEVLAITRATERFKDKPQPGVVLAWCLSDENGVRLFGDTEEDIDLINRQAMAPLIRCLKAANALNKLEGDALEGLEKNS